MMNNLKGGNMDESNILVSSDSGTGSCTSADSGSGSSSISSDGNSSTVLSSNAHISDSSNFSVSAASSSTASTSVSESSNAAASGSSGVSDSSNFSSSGVSIDAYKILYTNLLQQNAVSGTSVSVDYTIFDKPLDHYSVLESEVLILVLVALTLVLAKIVGVFDKWLR